MSRDRFNGWPADLGLFILRVVVGTVFIYHGSQKLFGFFDGSGLVGFAQYLESLGLPYPAYGAVAAGGSEFVGGLALITGIGTSWLAFPMVFTMGIACYYAHPHTFAIQNNGIEFPLSLAAAAAAIGLTGPGWITIPNLLSYVSVPELDDEPEYQPQSPVTGLTPAATSETRTPERTAPEAPARRPARDRVTPPATPAPAVAARSEAAKTADLSANLEQERMAAAMQRAAARRAAQTGPATSAAPRPAAPRERSITNAAAELAQDVVDVAKASQRAAAEVVGS